MRHLVYAIALFISTSALCAAGTAAEETQWHRGTTNYIDREFAEFKPFNTTAITVGESTLDVYISDGELAVSREVVVKWIKDAATSVSGYYGHFPVRHVTIVLCVSGRKGISGGVTYGGRTICFNLGRATKEKDFKDDWKMTHEMFHTAFADLDESHLWMEEGMAVYLEPIARARAGFLTAEDVWSGMADGLPNGLPERGDQGLDKTHTWGRTYWGGTLFWFLADIEIRKQTSNKHSLDDSMRAVLEAAGNGAARWEVERILEVGDKATETHVLHDLYEKMATKPVGTDLAALWKSLGVASSKSGVTFDDNAPLADVRKAILAAPAKASK